MIMIFLCAMLACNEQKDTASDCECACNGCECECEVE